MKKRILSILLALCMVLSIAPAAVFAEGSTAPADITGSGTAENPYLIYTAEGLKQFRDKVNAGETSLCAKLVCDIVLNDGTFDENGGWSESGTPVAWEPIGGEYTPYSGTFDGGGHTIKGLYVKDQKFAGLFGCVRSYPSGGKKSDFTVKDLTVTGYIDTNCKGVVYAGGITGYAEIRADESNAAGTISGCFNNVIIKARNINEYAYAGGIVGYAVLDNNSTGNIKIINCANNAAVTAHSENYHAYVGGIAGYILGYGTSGGYAVQKIDTCFNSGKISGSNSSQSSDFVGGILGHTTGNYFTDFSVDNCLNVGEVTGSGNTGVGGIVGGAEKTSVSNCCNAGKIGGNGGGIAGDMCNFPVLNCYYLKGTANMAHSGSGNEGLKTKEEFADGTVLNRLKNGDENSPWTKCGYLSAAGIIVPLLNWQTAESVDIIGAGTAEDPFLIYTAKGLNFFRKLVENGSTTLIAKLMNDIDLNNEAWTPIANYSGTFDGNRKTVSGLNVKDVQYAGLFSTLNDATVKNVTVTGNVAASETGTNAYAGAIAAYATGSTAITGCKSYATVTTTTAAGKNVSVIYAACAGGMVGYAANSVALTACVNNGTVLSTIRNNDDFSVQAYIGGIAGTAEGNVRFESCVNNGALSTDCKSAESNIGGIAGRAIGGTVIADCQNNGAVTGAVEHSEDPDIYYMFFTTGSNAGGIVGYGVAIRITGCHNAGVIRADSTGNYVGSIHIGGIAGYIISGVEEAVITDCGNVAAVTGTNSSMRVLAGGIVGFVNTDGTDVSFTNCYSTGAVSAASPTSKIEIGGIAGQILPSDNGGDIVIDNCCWLTGTVETAVGFNHKGLPVNASSKSAAEFADGTVLNLLKNNRTDSPWAKTDYLAAAGMTLPLLYWQTADAHDHNYNVQNCDFTHHWKECACGLIKAGSKAKHSAEIGICTDGIKCECGYEMYAPTSGHNWGDWVHNTTSHSRRCKNPGCGLTQSGNCSGGTATCTEQAECEVCHEKFGAKNPNNHTGILEWTRTASTHLQEWSCCRVEKVTEEGHEWANGVCTECRYTCDHIGGKATCKEKAVCDICGESYGKLNEKNHTDLKHTESKKATAAGKGNIEYWYCSGCDEYFSDENGINKISKSETLIDKLAPEMIFGEGAEIIEGEKKELIFKSNAAFEDFIRVELDGKTLDESNYDKKSGSIIITLKADYVSTLTSGEHSLLIVSQSGKAAAKLIVKAKENGKNNSVTDPAAKSPKTGVKADMLMLFSLIAISLISVGIFAISRKKLKN